MISTSGNWFVDGNNRVLMLHGVNLGGSTKVPVVPDGATYCSEGFFEHRQVSFIGRPFPLEQADDHYSRLKQWGFNCLRFLITWEAIEHAGPGIYDEEYLDYLQKVVRKAGDHGFTVFIDPHQDVWSRFSGGDGAPGWTLEAAGFDIKNFKETGAAIVHQTHGDPFPRMIWPTNAVKLAAATMFTLFFAGNDYAPNTSVDGIPIQDYMQDHFFASMRKVAEKLKNIDCVIGYDTFNEPQRGYVGVQDLRKPFGTLKLGSYPTPWQSIQLGAGFPQKVNILKQTIVGTLRTGREVVNQAGKSAWLPGRTCIWRENGVWDLDSAGNPILLKPDHFASARGEPSDFVHQNLQPFIQRFAETIHAIDPDAMIFMESEVEEDSPLWKDAQKSNVVYAPHWYDGVTLLLKIFHPWLGANSFTRKPVFGTANVQRSCNEQLRVFKNSAVNRLGNVPVLIGEIGIPFDLHKKAAYRTGDFRRQAMAMDRSMQALEANLLNYTIWNYTADNENAHGDKWNDEDLSIFSPDQQLNPADINSGGRALEAGVRPYPVATCGEPLRLQFDYRTGDFEYTFTSNRSCKAETILFAPQIQYPRGIQISVTDGSYVHDPVEQRVYYTHGDGDRHIIRFKRL